MVKSHMPQQLNWMDFQMVLIQTGQVKMIQQQTNLGLLVHIQDRHLY